MVVEEGGVLGRQPLVELDGAFGRRDRVGAAPHPAVADHGQTRRAGPTGFPQRLSADELAEFFLFDQRDQKVIRRRRGEQNRLGFAVQLGTVRYLCRFLEDPSAVPEPVVGWVARELGLPGAADIRAYACGEARWEQLITSQRPTTPTRRSQR